MTQAKLTSGDLVGYGGFLGGNDGTMVLEVGPAGAKVIAVSYAADGTPTFIKLPVNPVQSMVRLNTSNGYGSTNTAIRRFLNVVTNQGSDITYADSATLGATFTINTAGVYGISYNDAFAGAANLGLSLNSTQLTLDVSAITVGDRLTLATTAGVDFVCSVGLTLYLPSGSVIRAHAGGSGSASTGRTNFTITRGA